MRQWGFKGSGDGQFDGPVDIKVDDAGIVHVTDTTNHRMQTFDESGEFLRQWGSKGSRDGQFLFPTGSAIDTDGKL